MIRLFSLWITLAGACVIAPHVNASEIVGARINNMACDKFYFNVTGGSKTIRLQKFGFFGNLLGIFI